MSQNPFSFLSGAQCFSQAQSKDAVKESPPIIHNQSQETYSQKFGKYKNEMKTIKTKGLLLAAYLFLVGAAACQPAPKAVIAFESYRDGNAEVYLIDEDGGSPVNLTNNPAYDGTPDWSPDGSQIAFTSERGGSPDVFIMGVDGSEPTRLTDGSGFNTVPAWSPDGSRILFVSNRTYNVNMEGGYIEIPGNAKLWVMDLSGGNPERLTSQMGLDQYGSWSPDGTEIVYMSVRDGNPEIYRKRADNFEENLTNSPANDLNPDWSPDGTKVAFMSDRDGNLEIYVLDLERGELTNLTQSPANEGDPDWSPDGSKIAFTSDRDGNIEIYVMNADGSDQTRVTENPAKDFHPHWQPLGQGTD